MNDPVADPAMSSDQLTSLLPQLLHAERLGHVVIGAQLTRLNAIARSHVETGQNDDRHVCYRSDVTQQLESIDDRQIEIQNHKIRLERPELCQSGDGIVGGLDRIISNTSAEKLARSRI